MHYYDRADPDVTWVRNAILFLLSYNPIPTLSDSDPKTRKT